MKILTGSEDIPNRLKEMSLRPEPKLGKWWAMAGHKAFNIIYVYLTLSTFI